MNECSIFLCILCILWQSVLVLGDRIKGPTQI
ncbi:hypothetical protein LINPERPRIM_LOCUS25219 [Linum perenne]